MWKPPQRPSHKVTQAFNDGIITIYQEEDTAAPGYTPVSDLTRKISLRYEELRLGLQRFYTAKQNHIQIKRVVRCPWRDCVSTQDIAKTEDGAKYRIEMVQRVPDTYPASMDLTLSDLSSSSTGGAI